MTITIRSVWTIVIATIAISITMRALGFLPDDKLASHISSRITMIGFATALTVWAWLDKRLGR